MFGTAPWAAAFFDEPAAMPLMRALSLSFVFQGLTNIGVVAFQKKLEFHKEFAYRFSGILVDLVVAVTAAYLLRNAWALFSVPWPGIWRVCWSPTGSIPSDRVCALM